MATTGPLTRRRFAHIGALGVTGLSLGSVTRDASSGPRLLRSAPLLEIEIRVDTTSYGPRRTGVVQGGQFHGPRLAGTVMNGGVWIITRPDGTDEINLQATLRTDDDQTVSVRSRGLITSEGGAASESRATPIFETTSPRYSWLNRLVTVALGSVHPRELRYRVYGIG